MEHRREGVGCVEDAPVARARAAVAHVGDARREGGIHELARIEIVISNPEIASLPVHAPELE